jgi:hypothetical protein
MNQLPFDALFHSATGHSPYDYQRRLACDERSGRAEAEWLTNGVACQSRLINIPTGLGKRAGK